MRTPLTALILVTAALLGCATAPRVRGAGPAAPPLLRVWIGYPIGSSQVYPIFTNREAHVAMFEIVPGRGATMVYPLRRADAVASDAHYANFALQLGRMFYHSDPFNYAATQPRYYYAIASTAPLNLTRLQSSLGATRRVLDRMYGSFRPYDVIDRLTELVVPMQPNEDWATDLFVDWPMPPMPRFLAYRTVQCANGRLIQVASNYPYHGCPGDAQLDVVASAPEPPPKKLPADVRRPPRKGAGREGVELSSPTADGRRRAEAGARPPRAGPPRRSSPDGIRYSDDRSSARSRGGSSSTGGTASSPPRSTPSRSAERSPTVERSEPVSKPAAEHGTESGSERKP